MSTPDNQTPSDKADKPDKAMDAERCLFVLGLHRDGRPLAADVLAAARAHAAEHPATARAAEELALVSELVSELVDELPQLSASPGFSERVLAARGERQGVSRRIGNLPLARRVALAAALVLAVVLVYDASRPGDVLADPSPEKQVYEADVFRDTPYSQPDLEAGLAKMLPGPLDRSAASVVDDDGDDEHDDDDYDEHAEHDGEAPGEHDRR